jgi:DNA mismatch repair protein MutL
MSSKIRVLDEAVINRIAAGEVVERPASIVKELLENSIDAGATSVQIDIEDGGRKLIRVRDNGSGMTRDDAFLALERHATSKLRTEKDLQTIATMGFRGEALASIASISRLRLVTKDETEQEGTEIIIEAGVLRKSQPIGMGRSTFIEVRNLFYNVPVRRKFLKAAATEAAYIQELVVRYSLAFPALGITYKEDGKTKLDAPPVSSTLERVHALYAKEVRDNLIEVNHTLDRARLFGYVAKPPFARADMRSVLTFVNNRSVKDRLINAAVTRAFAHLMEKGRYPLAVLFIETPPEEVDVNVHPQKTEVRFRFPQSIRDLILDGVHQSLAGAPFRPPVTLGTDKWVHDPRGDRPWPGDRPRSPGPSDGASYGPRESAPDHSPIAPSIPGLGIDPAAASPTGAGPGRFGSLGIVGRVPGSFLVLHSDRDIIIMDHHAAHERVLFEELLSAQRAGMKYPSQNLLMPIVLEYPPIQAKALAAHCQLLNRLGLNVEVFGENAFAVKGIPPWLDERSLEPLFAELIEVMLDTGAQGDPERLMIEVVKRVACKTAVKETEQLQPAEVRALLAKLDQAEVPDVCPHGRPILHRIPLDEVRKKLGRR